MALSLEDTGEDREGSGRTKTEAEGRYREEKDGAAGVV